MDYFHWTSAILGCFMLFSVAFHYTNFSAWSRFYLAWVPEQRPAWLPVFNGVMLGWVLTTYYLLSRQPSAFNFIVSLVVTLGAVKAILFSTQYQLVRKFILALVEKEALARHVAMISSLAIGAALIWLAFL